MKIALDFSPVHTPHWLSPVMVCNIRNFLRFFSLHVRQISHHCPLPFRSNCDEPFGVSEQVVQNYGFACKSQITSFRFVLDSTKTAWNDSIRISWKKMLDQRRRRRLRWNVPHKNEKCFLEMTRGQKKIAYFPTFARRHRQLIVLLREHVWPNGRRCVWLSFWKWIVEQQ